MTDPMPTSFPLMFADPKTSAPDGSVVAPWDGAAIGTVGAADSDAIDRALATAARLYEDRDAWLPVPRRIEILENTARIMSERAEYLAVESAREGGKPLADSRAEVARAIDGVKLCIEGIRTQHGTEVPMGINGPSLEHLAFTRFEPRGPVVAVSAFNHPVNLIVHQVGPAVAAGCPVIVKPAEDTPLSCMRFAHILKEAGLPDGWVQAGLTANHSVAEQLVTDPRVAFFSFIGSAKVGWMLRSKLSAGTRCALEHGGVAPVIVHDDADVDDVMPRLVKGGFYHAGQVCVSVQRVFVHKSIAKDFAKDMAARAEKLTIGNPTLESTEVGPLIRHRETDRVAEWVNAAKDGGAEVLCGAEKLSDATYACTVLYDPPADAAVTTKEVFGPVVCIYPYDDVDEAIARANALPYSFQASVCTANLDIALRAYARLAASAVMVNEHTAFRVDWMPFAGLKHSGHGVGGIHHTMRDMQVEKMMVIRSKEV